jgi:hypothetical protein
MEFEIRTSRYPHHYVVWVLCNGRTLDWQKCHNRAEATQAAEMFVSIYTTAKRTRETM